MSFAQFNSSDIPTDTLLLRWSRKGKGSAVDSSSLLSCFPTQDITLVSFTPKQGKAIVQLPSIELATDFVSLCESECVKLNGALAIHPSYCVLSKPREIRTSEAENISETMDGVSIIDLDSSTVCSLLSMYAEVDQSFDTTLLLPEINEVLHSDYTVCLVYQITTQPFPLFLEHHLWGDEFVAFVVTPRGIEWKLEIRADSIYRHQGKNQLVRIEGAARFAHLSVFTSLSEGLLVVVTTKRKGLCHCAFPDYCHTRLVEESKRSVPLAVENEHVYAVYDRIAGHFSSTRYSQWEGVVGFLHSLPYGSLVLDLGCGNGKYMAQERSGLCIVGCDRSFELLRICRQQDFDVTLVDGVFLPYRDSCFDAVISVAVVHHLSTNALRRRFLAHFIRVLKRGGRGLIVVWALEKDTSGRKTKSNRGYEKADVMVQWQLQKKYSNGEEEPVYQRYYHMFQGGELEWLLRSFGEIEITQSWYERENWFVEIEKRFTVCL